MKATKTIRTLIAACIGFFCLSGYAAAEENELALNMGANAEYVVDIQETSQALQEVQIPENGGIGNEIVVTVFVAYVVAPWCMASTALIVFSGLSPITDALTTEKNEAPDIKMTQDIEIAKADR